MHSRHPSKHRFLWLAPLALLPLSILGLERLGQEGPARSGVIAPGGGEVAAPSAAEAPPLRTLAETPALDVTPQRMEVAAAEDPVEVREELEVAALLEQARTSVQGMGSRELEAFQEERSRRLRELTSPLFDAKFRAGEFVVVPSLEAGELEDEHGARRLAQARGHRDGTMRVVYLSREEAPEAWFVHQEIAAATTALGTAVRLRARTGLRAGRQFPPPEKRGLLMYPEY